MEENRRMPRAKVWFTILLSLLLVFSMVGTTLAAAPGITPFQASNALINLVRGAGGTTATGEISASTHSAGEYLKATAYLEEWVSTGVYAAATDVTTTVQTKTVYNTSVIFFSTNWNVKSNKTYRLRVIIEDKNGGVVYRSTCYSSSI